MSGAVVTVVAIAVAEVAAVGEELRRSRVDDDVKEAISTSDGGEDGKALPSDPMIPGRTPAVPGVSVKLSGKLATMSSSLLVSTELNFRRFLSGESECFEASAGGYRSFIANIPESEYGKGKGGGPWKEEKGRQWITDGVERREA